jgi:hypothetical protein
MSGCKRSTKSALRRPFAKDLNSYLFSTVQLGLARSNWAAFLVSPVWLGSVVACGMTDRMTT